MRTLSATLLAAALSLRGRPSLSVNIRDKRLRWTNLHWEDGSTRWSDQEADGAVIHRVRSNGTNVEWCKVTAVATEAEWTNWAVVLVTDVVDCEVAIARVGSDDIRIYAIRVDVADTTWDIVYADSTDGGANWDAAWSVAVAGIDGAKAGDAAEQPRIAARKDCLIYTDAGEVKARRVLWGVAPHAPVTWAGLGVLTVRGGLGIGWDAARFPVAAAGAGNISIGLITPSDPLTWSTARQIAPGGEATPTDSSVLSNPSVLYADGLYLISWLDKFTVADPNWTQPVIVSSTDWVHFGNEVALAIWATTYRRVGLAYIASTETIYAANEKIICQAALYESDDALQNLTNITPTVYRRDTDERGSRLHLEILNVAGKYDTVDQAGEYGQCIRPLATVELSRGYNTTAGAERETLDPHYVLTAEITQGFGRGRLVIKAVDGWGLLDLWRANEVLSWSGETIEWLLTEICARVGLTFEASAQAEFDYALGEFSAHPGQSGAQVVRTLLVLAGAVAYFQEDGVMKAYNLYGWSPSYFDVGGAKEILQGGYATATVPATSFRVFGDTAGAAGAMDWHSMALGLRLNKNRQDYRLGSDGACAVVQRYDWSRSRIADRRDWVEVPMRPDAELWDRVRVFARGDVLPPGDIHRLVGISERWESRAHRYVTRLEMQDA